MKTMLMQNCGVTKEHYGLSYNFLSWSIRIYSYIFQGHIKQDSIPGLQVFFLRNKEEAYQ